MSTLQASRIVLLPFLVLLLPTEIRGQSSADLLEQFAGMLQLASWDNHLEDGTTRPNPRSDGHIMYTEAGRMCYFGTDPSRIEWAFAASPTPAEALNGMLGMGGYCASVEINVEEGFVPHHVELDKVPN